MKPQLHAHAAPLAPPAVAFIGRAAVAALHDELALEPKPGLVSFADSGSHADMDARTFMRSLFALRHGLLRLAALGASGAGFEALRQQGRAAEVQMLVATGGINTHRGAIFTLGLLCAAAGALAAQGQPLRADVLRAELQRRWGHDLAAHAARPAATHGTVVAQHLGLRGAAAEAALGFPVLFETTLPALCGALRGGLEPRRARLQALFETLAVLDDTTLAHRGGGEGLRWAQAAARGWLQGGGAAHTDALPRARALHLEFIARRLSPGGSADLLAAACLLHRLGALR
jgi:triphosphoribosyl-dephospho-CoA synthase